MTNITMMTKAATLASVSVASVLVASAPADAEPTGCSVKVYSSTNYAYSYCRANQGQHRVVLTCRDEATFKAYGAWQRAGQQSWSFCPSPARLILASYQAR